VIPRTVRSVRPSQLPGVAAGYLAQEISQGVSRSGRAFLAVGWGELQELVLTELAGRSLPWPEIQIYFTTDRRVPGTDPRSSFGAVQRSLLAHCPIPAKNVHPMPIRTLPPRRAAAAYEASLPSSFDAMLLSLRRDGGVAGLAPESDLISDESARVAVAPGKDGLLLTLTPRAILGARCLVMVGMGEECAETARRAIQERYDPVACPAQLARGGIWVLDPHAARTLQGPSNPRPNRPGSPEPFPDSRETGCGGRRYPRYRADGS